MNYYVKAIKFIFLSLTFYNLKCFSNPISSEIYQNNYKTTVIYAPLGKIIAEIADTDEKHINGLSNRADLAQGLGMLFVYPQTGIYKIWMKDMNFSLDIIWLDDKKKIIYMKENISPETYKQKTPIIYSPESPNTLYILEIPAGDAKRLGLHLNATMIF